MNKTKIILFFILTLLLGGVIGFFTSGRLIRNRMEKRRSLMENRNAEKEHLTKHLGLNENQLESLDSLLNQSLGEQHMLRRKHRREMNDMRARMFDQILPELTEEQQENAQKMRRRKERPRPPING